MQISLKTILGYTYADASTKLTNRVFFFSSLYKSNFSGASKVPRDSPFTIDRRVSGFIVWWETTRSYTNPILNWNFCVPISNIQTLQLVFSDTSRLNYDRFHPRWIIRASQKNPPSHLIPRNCNRKTHFKPGNFITFSKNRDTIDRSGRRKGGRASRSTSPARGTRDRLSLAFLSCSFSFSFSLSISRKTRNWKWAD